MNFSERNLGKVFKTELENQRYCMILKGSQNPYYTNFRVHLNKRVPTRSKKFKRFWEAEGLNPTDIPPPQPEIDMILEDDNGNMRAIELKVIRKYKRCLRPSYYRGIGQTLAYLSYGFPQVALWLCFDGDSMEDKEIYEYNEAFTKIIFPLKSFIGTTFFKILRSGQTLKIQDRLWKGEKHWWESGIGVPINGTHRITWKTTNLFLTDFQTPKGPMRFNLEISRRAKTIYKFLEGQRKLWKR